MSSFPRTGNFGTLDLTDRELSQAFFNSVYNSSAKVAIEWDGTHDPCNPGTISNDFMDSTLTRINWYRAMAGVPSTIQFDTAIGGLSEKSQDSALYMSRNDKLTHYPVNTDPCYTGDAYTAAGYSNISIGNFGWDAVMSQMRDNGPTNTKVGHRRWLIYPETQTMGTGDISPAWDGGYNGDSNGDNIDDLKTYYRKSNNIYVQDGTYGSSGAVVRDGFIAWPPPGYVPYNVVYPRWSFSYRGANFANATVSMTKVGASVDIEEEDKTSTGYGENTITWVPENYDADDSFAAWENPGSDTSYTITISGIADAPQNEYTYTTTIYDPQASTGFETIPSVYGSDAITTNGATYSHDTLPWAESHEWREISLTSTTYTNGAESGTGEILAGIEPRYDDLISNLHKKNGNNSFHLAHMRSGDDEMWFEIDQEFILNDSSYLKFWSLLRYATADQHAKAQISLDGGGSWIDLEYSQDGTGGAGDTAFIQRSIPLIAYTGYTAKFRFIYTLDGPSLYSYDNSPTKSPVGLFIDDIEITNANIVTEQQSGKSSGPGEFTYIPSSDGVYFLQARAVPWENMPGLTWGHVKFVTVTESACTNTATNLEVTQDLLDTCSAAGTRNFDGSNSLFTDNTFSSVTIPSDGFPWSFTSDGIITLNPGFNATSGSDFSATINP